MPAKYPDETRTRARDLSLAGETDRAIAQELGLSRADTVREWRRAEGWDELKAQAEREAAAKVAETLTARKTAVSAKHDQLGEALEGAVARVLRARTRDGQVDLKPSEIRALAATLETTQRIRRTALGVESASTDSEPALTRIVFAGFESPDSEGAGHPSSASLS